MKRFLSWLILLLLIGVHTSLAAPEDEDSCEGVLLNGVGAQALTAKVTKAVSAEVVNDPKQESIQIYVNLDESGDIKCDDMKGFIEFGDKCKMTYNFDTVKKALKFTIGGKDATEPDGIKYDAEGPHQAIMTMQKEGVMFRGPPDDKDTTPIPESVDCWTSDTKFLLTKLQAPSAGCVIQLEFKTGLRVENPKFGDELCPDTTEEPPLTPGPSDNPDPGPDTIGPTGAADTTSPPTTGTGSTTKPPVEPTTTPTTLGTGSTKVPPTGATTTIPGGPTNNPDESTTTPDGSATTGGSESGPPPVVTEAITVSPTEAESNLVVIIVGVVVGVIILLIIVGIIVYCFCFRKKKDGEEDAEAGEGEKDAEAEGTEKSDADKKEPEAAAEEGAAEEGAEPEAENTQRDSDKKGSDQTQSEGADNTDADKKEPE